VQAHAHLQNLAAPEVAQRRIEVQRVDGIYAPGSVERRLAVANAKNGSSCHVARMRVWPLAGNVTVARPSRDRLRRRSDGDVERRRLCVRQQRIRLLGSP